MIPRLSQLRLVWCLAALPAICLFAIQITSYIVRPMFADQFGRGEVWLLWGWTGVPGIIFDVQGTGIKIDRKLNLIVVFERFYPAETSNAANAIESQAVLARSLERTWSSATFQSSDGVEYRVPRKRNVLYVFERDGRFRTFDLASGKAVECYDAVTRRDIVETSINEVLKEIGVVVDQPK